MRHQTLELKLVAPTEELVPSYLDFIAEMEKAGEKIWLDNLPRAEEDHAAFVDRLLKGETHPEENKVPESIFWAVLDQTVVGKLGFRHRLNDNLRDFGGHIGYEVRPSFRNRGIAKQMLSQVLSTARAKEIGQLLLTCAPDNTASNRTILANGGVLEKTEFVRKWDRQTNYYWITVE
ncbi:MAG: GNAT family N-acetyltransferase [Bdellovibrionales bacterium]